MVLGLATAAAVLPLKVHSQGFKVIDLSPLPALVSAQSAKTPGAGESNPGSKPEVSDEPFYVLCYHRFLRHTNPDAEPSQSEYQMPLDEFKWQMQYLKDNGFHPVSEDELMGYWFQGKPLPLKPVLITFDDGFRTIYRDAFPVLKAHGYPSILFLYTKFIEYGEAALKRRADDTKKHKVNLGTEALEDDDILSMQPSDMVVESHTAHHLNLGKENEKKDVAEFQKLLNYEITEPLSFIETRFKHKPEWLAYPYGVYDPAILKAVHETGYKLAFSVNPGPNDRTVPPLMLKRDLVLYPISHEGFARIFQEKVLHMKNLTPGDGDLIKSQKPLITAQILDEVVPRSIQLQIGNHIMRVQYDPRTHVFRRQVGVPLAQGGHMLTARAKDVKGVSRVYNWYFRIKYKKSEKNNEEEGGYDAIQN